MTDFDLNSTSVVCCWPGQDAPAVQYSYDVTDPPARGRRKLAAVDSRSEDHILTRDRRDRMNAEARDLARNYALVEWMVRRHLDYVATFEFQAVSQDEGLNHALEDWVAEWSKPENLDRAGRHDLDRFIRLAESMAVLDGDYGVVRLANGQIQGVESDRIRTPHGLDFSALATAWSNGVRIDEAGRALAFAVHRRQVLGGWQFERQIPANNLYLHGYYRRYDQVRGVSPLSGALSHFRDVYESFDLALAKAKVSQLFAMIVTRSGEQAEGEVAADEAGAGYSVDFGKGPIFMDLDPGDDAKFLNDSGPSDQFRAFLMAALTSALKALDIPFSFYDESHTNFFGSRGAWLHYERSSRSKRLQVQRLLDTITAWRMAYAVTSGELPPPSGMTLAEVLDVCTWVPVGMPWWKPAEELRGDLDAIAAGLTTFERVAREHGFPDPKDNIRANAALVKFAESVGFPLVYARQGQDPVPADPADPTVIPQANGANAP